jgi:hypothetical protein
MQTPPARTSKNTFLEKSSAKTGKNRIKRGKNQSKKAKKEEFVQIARM